MSGEPQILIALDRFSKWPTVKICKTSETKEVIGFLSNQFNLYGIPEKIKYDKGGGHLIRPNTKKCANPEILKYSIAHPECIPETEQLKEQYKQ